MVAEIDDINGWKLACSSIRQIYHKLLPELVCRSIQRTRYPHRLFSSSIAPYTLVKTKRRTVALFAVQHIALKHTPLHLVILAKHLGLEVRNGAHILLASEHVHLVRLVVPQLQVSHVVSKNEKAVW